MPPDSIDVPFSVATLSAAQGEVQSQAAVESDAVESDEIQSLQSSPRTRNTVASEAPVPWHTQVTIGGMLSFFVYTFPSLDSIDEVARVETFSKIIFPEYMSLEFVTFVRLLFSFIIFYDCVYTVLWGQ